MKRITKFISVMLFAAMLIASACPFANAENIIDIEIDIGDLFAPEEGETGDTDTGDTGDDAGTTEGEDNKNTTGGSMTTVDMTGKGDKKDEEDSKDTTTDNTKDDETKEEETKDEEKVYNSKFTDVAEDAWYYSYVTSLASKGIITGYPNGTFAPQGNITRAEFIKLLVECMGYELTNNDVFEDVTKDDAKDWYYTYVSAAADNKIISVEEYGKEFKGDEKITREEVAALIIKATGVETGKYATPYIDTDDENIVALYTICLMQGTVDDKSGDRYFFPTQNITRAEVSAVFTRLLEYNADKETFVKEKMAEYGMTELKLLSLPETDAEYYETVKNAGLTPALTFSVEIKNPLPGDMEQICSDFTEAFIACSSSHPEYFTHLVLDITHSTAENGTGHVFFSFDSSAKSFTLSELCEINAESIKQAKLIADSIYQICPQKDALSLADGVHDYIAENTVYSQGETDLDYLSMGVFREGKAVCQGYSAAFNLICKELGIQSISVSNDEHMWNAVKHKNSLYYYDCTWDDMGSGTENTYRRVGQKLIKDTHGEFSFYEFALWN